MNLVSYLLIGAMVSMGAGADPATPAKKASGGCCSGAKPTTSKERSVSSAPSANAKADLASVEVSEGDAGDKKAKYPGTAAGRAARAFIEAFNSGDRDRVRIAAEAHRSKSALESRSMDERLEQYARLYKDWGRLDVRSFEEHDDGSLTLSVKPDRGFGGLNMTFDFEKAGGKLDQIRIRPTVLTDDTGDDVNGGTLGEITVLSDSIQPLRDHFNANNGKYRFVAILSPT